MNSPSTHCSDRQRVPSGFLPLYSPIQIPACLTVRQTAPPQSLMSSSRLWGGGWDKGDTNINGRPWNRSCWCSPAERCCWRRQICGENRKREVFHPWKSLTKQSFVETPFEINRRQNEWTVGRIHFDKTFSCLVAYKRFILFDGLILSQKLYIFSHCTNLFAVNLQTVQLKGSCIAYITLGWTEFTNYDYNMAKFQSSILLQQSWKCICISLFLSQF